MVMHSKCVKMSTVVGAFLLVLPSSLAWYWGNVSVYALSYVVYVEGSASSVQAPWIISIFLTSSTAAVLICDVIARFVKRRLLILIGILLSNLTTFMSYFTIQYSMALLIFTYSLLNGVATGFICGNAIYLVIQCADKDMGVLSSILHAGFPTGAVIITQVITWFCNPHNDIPDLERGNTVYFTQKEVLDKVPAIFLVLGSFSLATHTVAFILLQFSPDIKGERYLDDVKVERQPISETHHLDKEDKSMSTGVSQNPSKDHTPKEVLKSVAFYYLWLSLFMNDFPFLLLANYYKLFGQIWIHDDIFLTNMGTAMLIFSFVVRLAWGFCVDRLGVKFSLMCLFGSLSFMSSWYYFTARIHRWLYFIANLLFGSICSSIFGCYLAATAVLFGKTHVSTHFGMLMTASMVFNSVGPSLLKSVLIHFGWFFTFASSSAINILNLIFCLIFMRN